MILLTGVTGRIGGAAARSLIQSGVAFRALIRNPDKIAQFEHPGVEVIHGDLENSDDRQRALAGVSKTLMVVANNERQAKIERSFALDAAAAGVRHLVKISSMEATAEAVAPIPRLHFESEQFVKSLEMSWTILQPNFFMQNLLMFAHSIARNGEFALPLGQAKTGLIDARDVGAVAALILQQHGHENRSYRLSGSELLSFSEVAARLSTVVGKEIRYVDQPPEEFRAFLAHFVSSEWHLTAICAIFAEIANHALEELSPSVNEILGRHPISVEQFATDFAGAFA